MSKTKINYFSIKDKKFTSYKKILIIAEIGSNHNNDFKLCKKLIYMSKQAGCDGVKFQFFKANLLVQENTRAYGVLKKLEMFESWIPKISKICKLLKLYFVCSVFDVHSAKVLKKYCDIIKIASPEIKNIPLIKSAIKTKLPLIISTGYSDPADLKKVFKLIPLSHHRKFSFLHCTSQYPCTTKNLNLNMINYLTHNYNSIPIGFSDHSLSTNTGLSAVATGACIVEKHITLSKKLKGPDHFFALDQKELISYVRKIREFELSHGSYAKKKIEDENTVYVSIVSKKKLSKDHKIKQEDLICKRTYSEGIGSDKIIFVLNKKVKKNIQKDHIIKISDIY